MFRSAINIFKIPDLRNKVIFTIALLAIYRIGFHIPVPGVDQQARVRLETAGVRGGVGRYRTHQAQCEQDGRQPSDRHRVFSLLFRYEKPSA